MNKQRKVLITITYNEMGIIIDTKAEEVAQPDAPDTNVGKISRQAAIDVNGLDEEIRCEMCKNTMHTDRGCDGNCRYDEKLYKKIIQILDKRINPLPSAQPEPHWIPCSDRMPDQYGNYLVSIEGDEPDIGTINPNNPRGWSLCDASGFYWASDKYLNITAWMPLPEPYREEGTE